ncbi:MAG: acyl-CoA carboxylase subunit beta [Chloroflexi bacterium]|nr:acyl-CoA carboxylase subunit beta [Chloroflexota bacterium]
MQEEIEQLRRYRELALKGGGEAEMAEQQKRGKLFARDRIQSLLDKDSFVEIGMFVGHDFLTEQEKTFGDGLITGWGAINQKKVAIMAHDRTIHRGSVGKIGRSKYCELLDKAVEFGVPFIGLMDAPGARIEVPQPGGVDHGFLRFSFFKRHALASGVIPQISAILGTCAGNAVYGPALGDFIIMVEGIGNMLITGPGVIKEVTGAEVTIEELGGARVHCQLTGVADFRVKTEEECFHLIRLLLSFLPQNCAEKPPHIDTGDDPNRTDDSLAGIVPTDLRKTYDVRQVIKKVVDNGDFLEVKADFARNAVTGFARLNGRTVGISANQPLYLAGCLNVDSSDKQARFIRFCDAFNIPLIFLVDNPGYLPGMDQEHSGIIRHGAKTLYAIAEATVPKLSVLLRKATGGGIAGSGGDKDLGIDRVFAWPIASKGVLGAEAAARVIFKQELESAADPEALRAQKVAELRQAMSGPYMAAAVEEVDEVLEPAETRKRLIAALEVATNKHEARHYRKHGIMPV